MSHSLDVQVSVRCTSDLIAKLDAEADARRLKRADVIREILWSAIDRRNVRVVEVPQSEGMAAAMAADKGSL